MKDQAIPVVALGVRSHEEELGKNSAGDQVRIIRERALRESGRFIYSERADHGTGFRGNRGEETQAAMDDARRAADEYGRAELWLFKSERVGRGSGRRDEARSVLEVYVEMRRAGVDLRSVEDDAYVTNPMLVGIADAMAHKYSQDLSAHVRCGLGENARKGIPHGAPKLGYRRTEPTDEDRLGGRKHGKHWEKDDADRVALRRRLFVEVTERGGVPSSVAKLLNAERIPSTAGARWSPAVVRRLLMSRDVLGEFPAVEHRPGCPGGRCRCPTAWHKGQHRAIVERERWEAAQRALAENAKYAPNGRSGRRPKNHLLIRGRLKCGLCGATMLPRSDRGREWYECRTRCETGGPGACRMPRLERVAVEGPLLSLFERVALDVHAT